MKNYSTTNIKDNEKRVELHDTLGLTGAEISVNTLAAGEKVPFAHSHRQNEEIYAILSGRGKAVVDGDEIPLAKGDWLRISPAGKRQFFAAEEEALTYVCIQVKAGSLEEYTMTDGVVAE